MTFGGSVRLSVFCLCHSLNCRVKAPIILSSRLVKLTYFFTSCLKQVLKFSKYAVKKKTELFMVAVISVFLPFACVHSTTKDRVITVIFTFDT